MEYQLTSMQEKLNAIAQKFDNDLSSLFLSEVNWRSDLSSLLTEAYQRQCMDFSADLKEEVLSALGETLDLRTGFLLEEEGLRLFVAGDSVLLSYEELTPYINQESSIWQKMQPDAATARVDEIEEVGQTA